MKNARASLPACALLLALAACGGGGGTGNPLLAFDPTITVTLPPGPLDVGQVVEVRVTAQEFRATFDITLLNPPAGMTFTPKKAVSGVGTARGRWRVDPACVGWQHLVFEVRKSAAEAVQKTASVRVQPSHLRAAVCGVLSGDVTRDGLPDVVMRAPGRDGGPSLADSGELYVFASGAALAGSPTTRLIPSSPAPGARVGGVDGTQGFQLADVTGDGHLDVVALAPSAGSTRGQVFEWHDFFGGAGSGSTRDAFPSLEGTFLGRPITVGADVLPTETLVIEDVDADGFRDRVIAAPGETVNSRVEAGAVHLFRGAPNGISGTHFTLQSPAPVLRDRMGQADSGPGLLVHDLTGDGVPEILVAVPGSDLGGLTDRGAIYVWSPAEFGDSFTPSPIAILRPPTDGFFNVARLTSSEPGIRIGDVTGDGLPDVVAGAVFAGDAGTPRTGAILVWKGGSAIHVLDPDPIAILRHAAPIADERLGLGSPGLRLADVTGDGVLDVLATGGAVAPADVGFVAVFRGGAEMESGPQTEDALLMPTGATFGEPIDAWETVDVTGDGVLDVVVSVPTADHSRLSEAGRITVWAGGAALTGAAAPVAFLQHPDPADFDQFGARFDVLDVTGDGIGDVVVSSGNLAVPAVPDRSAAFLFAGGAGLTGVPAPTATFALPPEANANRLRLPDPHIAAFGDVTGDGVGDLLFAMTQAGTGGPCLAIWDGTALAGAPLPRAFLGSVEDQVFGSPPGIDGAGGAVQLCDLTGDGVLDVRGLMARSGTGAAAREGAALLWTATSLGAGTPTLAPSVRFGGGSANAGLGANGGHAAPLVDLSGDGVADLLLTLPGADDDAGKVLWQRRPLFLGADPNLPTRTFRPPTVASGDQFGR